jgi:GntR family transcriptional regulator
MSDVPPSRRIADELRALIVSGALEPGAKLPSERELAKSHGAARNTARQAIAILMAEGLVEAQHGRGVFVRRWPQLRRLAHDRYARRYREAGKAPFQTEAERQERTPRVEVTSIGPVPAPSRVAERLGIQEGEQVLLRRNRYRADRVPVQLADTYVLWTIADGSPLLQEVPAPGGIYACLEDLGHPIARMTEDVTARMPLPDEAEALEMGRGVPVIELFHTTFDRDGLAIEVTHSILPADRNLLTFELPVE